MLYHRHHQHNIATSHSVLFDVGRCIVLTATMSRFFIVMQTFSFIFIFVWGGGGFVNDVASIRNSLLPSGRPFFVGLFYIRPRSLLCHPWIQNEWSGEKKNKR